MTSEPNNTPPPNGYLDIILTDVKLHATKPRKPTLMARAIERTMHNRKPGRFFGKRVQALNKDGKPQAEFKIADLEPLEELARKTGKQIRILMPKGGIPIYLSKDAEELVEAHQRKKKKPT